MPLTGYEYVLSRYYSGALTKEQFQTEVDRLQTMNTDWFDLLTKDSFSKDYAINVSGGSDNIRYYASLGYTSEDDVIRRTTNRRYTAAAKLDMTLSSRWRLSFNLNGYLNERKYTQDEVKIMLIIPVGLFPLLAKMVLTIFMVSIIGTVVI